MDAQQVTWRLSRLKVKLVDAEFDHEEYEEFTDSHLVW